MKTTDADRGQRALGAYIGANGVPLGGTGFSVVKTGTGAYTVRVFGFRALLSVVASAYAGANFATAYITSPDVVTVGTYNFQSTAVDVAFNLTVTGVPR